MLHDFLLFSQVKSCQMCSNSFFKNVNFLDFVSTVFHKMCTVNFHGKWCVPESAGHLMSRLYFLEPDPKQNVESLDCTHRNNSRSQQNAVSATDFTREWPLQSKDFAGRSLRRADRADKQAISRLAGCKGRNPAVFRPTSLNRHLLAPFPGHDCTATGSRNHQFDWPKTAPQIQTQQDPWMFRENR